MPVRAHPLAPPARRGRADWARAAGAALLLHAAVLGGSRLIGPPNGAARTAELPVRVAVVRHFDLAPPALAVAPATPSPSPDPARRSAAVTRALDTARSPAHAPANPDPEPMVEPPGHGADASPPPVYPTRLPPAFTWHYVAQRGLRTGRSELRFTRDDGDYQLGWETHWPDRETLGLASRGGIDAAGLAPERFADRRRGRERQAANFDRGGSRITYSGPQVEHALLAGAQDRLSWMVQLPAIVDADPAAFAEAGARVQLQVTGARGDAAVWTFVVQGRGDLDLPAGVVRGALVLVREPQRPYDTRVEVWLDAARHHLPVQLRLTPVPGGAPLEMRLDTGPSS